jgi:hypothetical protein
LPEELTLELMPSTSSGPLFCPLCGTLFQPERILALLDEGDVPMGCVCDRCFMTGPHVAAQAVHQRSLRLYDLIKNARPEVSPAIWVQMSQAVQDRLTHWNRIIDQLETLGWWVLKVSDLDREPTA